jgi:hypothetical protein
MERPPEGSDPEVQVYMVLKAGNKGDPNSLFYDLFQDDSCYDNFT